ncbi:MAG: Cell division protein ftsA [Parcubacteria group bacterium GW2011_GWB1_49_7]|uniref:Cell division protein FtsA n=1 Tax=Candidatus Zambryskibacteria bacterium RIFCSPHIGHO2_01_FULL_46_25 TaxID=1802738 RepID=A0A1G2T004_9BACT|nr:MAG: Cell division protein ftsA [Parcubacteria group bacterium GW2011_GWB1_49_7]OHA90442.1 MAG: cell division protein FtsA [Candidatus Zambryskibacteria bacterium RIFCSPHIGHO2_01_FULL_46_25]OHB00613.1 MAG: cell division protein FtsA [Candidatus Zambryskibacteria bacterium RIFCSPHIGHO2_12_FULL_48_10]OHB06980.1 MAG: cell division protein FtsA [Candidatus Zambryskibacteria bacterium RIFCSPLOWO2_01_FULL_48_25]
MARQITVGIDIGTSQVKAIIAEGALEQGHFSPRIIGAATAESKGLERGYILNAEEAAESVRLAVNRAEKTAGVRVRRAYVSFGGIGLGSIKAEGSVAISRADMEITERDLAQVLEAAEQSIPAASILNKRIINTIPIEYKIDGKPVWGDALGLKAQKLEVKALFITCLEHHLAELIKTVETAGLEVVDVVAAPVAASFVTVSKKERRVGCLLADIGAETLSLIVFENNNPTSLEVFPIGGNDITNDIALGLKLPLEDAENVKQGGIARTPYSKKKLEEIVLARLGDCFDLVETHLKKIGRDSLLPAGVLLTGGSASVSSVKTFAEEFLGLPSRIAEIHFGTNEKNRMRDNVWATACGLALLGFNAGEKNGFSGSSRSGLLPGSGRGLAQKISRLISQILP